MPIFPSSGGGAGFTGYAVQYVSPSGNNSAAGTLNAPKKTQSAAAHVLADGGEIYCAPGSKWSDGTEGLGLTDGQGMWMNDGTPVPGFIQQKNITFKGWGTTTYSPFGTQAAQVTWGKATGSTTRDNPGVWMANVQAAVSFKNLYIVADQPVRVGWDYRRAANYSVTELPITNATRLNGRTTFTVTLTPAEITSFRRDAGVVTVKYTLDECYSVPRQFCHVRINAGNQSAVFPSGDYLVEGSIQVSPTVYTFSYKEGSGDHNEVFPSGATYATTGVAHGDTAVYGVVEVTSGSAEFPSTMYLTAGAVSDADKFIVRDPYGGNHGRTANVSVNNVGTFRLQLRYLATSFETFDDCLLYSTPFGGERFGIGPTVDKGEVNGGAEWSWYRRNYLQGGVTGDPTAQQEIARTSNLFMTGVNAVGIGAYQWQMSQGGIYQPIANGSSVSCYDTILQDTAIGTPIFPTLTMESGTMSLYIKDVSIADFEQFAYAADLGQVAGPVTVINTPCTGGLTSVFDCPPVVMGGNVGGDFWTTETKSYEQRLWNGYWGRDGRIAGKRDDIQSSFGIIQHPGFSNLANTDISAWTASGAVSVTANQSNVGLDKTDRAFKLHCSAGGGASVYFDVTTPASAVGDTVVVGFWVKAATDTVTGVSGLLSSCIYDPANQGIPVIFQYVPFGNDGAWDWVVDKQTILSSQTGQSTLRFSIFVSQGHDILVYMPQLVYLPAATYSANEAARQLRVSRTVPTYLASGCAGTMPEIKLIGHGGLGVSSTLAKTVGVGSGQLTLTGSGTTYIPIYAQDGTTIQGWIAQLQATVNP